jgi:hypothetical protein
MPSSSTNVRGMALLVSSVLALATAACHDKVKAAPPVASAPAPVQPAPSNPAPGPAPKIEADTQPPAVPSTSPSPSPPPPPRKPVPKKSDASEQPAEASRPTAPQMTPQLSPDDQANFERRTNDDLSVAEKNLQQSSGKQLNATQQDLAEKVRNFLGQSREASKSGDWTRAQTLAQKARLLSVELVNSL